MKGMKIKLAGYSKEHIIAYAVGAAGGVVLKHVGNAVLQPESILAKGLVGVGATVGGMMITNGLEKAMKVRNEADKAIKFEEDYVILEF